MDDSHTYVYPFDLASTSNCKRQLSSEDDTQTKRAKHSDDSHLTKIKPIKKEEKSSAASSDTSSGNVVEMCPVKQVNLGEKTNKYKYYMTYVHRGIHSSFNRGSAISLGSEYHSNCLHSRIQQSDMRDWILRLLMQCRVAMYSPKLPSQSVL